VLSDLLEDTLVLHGSGNEPLLLQQKISRHRCLLRLTDTMIKHYDVDARKRLAPKVLPDHYALHDLIATI